ncbi:MAG: XRE family transcriptional regulator [Proteobacteria bacterium]|nr:XRE family transcriptional regulator [Pseudomonadota bacterium]
MHGTEYLARRLKEHRRRLGLASDYVAKALDISVEDLEHYEYGGKPITKEDLIKLADFYRVSPSYFLGGWENLN